MSKCNNNDVRGDLELYNKYGVMIFKANYGYQSNMKLLVKSYVKELKLSDPKVIVIEEVDDFKAKTWIVGNADNIQKMVNDELSQNK